MVPVSVVAGYYCPLELQSVVDGVVHGQGIALLLRQDVTVLGSVRADTFVAAAVRVPQVGVAVVVSVYIPPVRIGFATRRYVEIV